MINKTSLNKLFWVCCLLLGIILLFTYYKYYTRIGAFGCFDDCHTISSGYFMTRGRQLYSQIFYNHQMLMPYISFSIQTIVQPSSLYSLILSHRLFIYAFSILFDIFLAWRFHWKGLGFVVMYETTKFYFFGDRFLPEALVSFSLAYLLGLAWEKINRKDLSKFDYIVAAILTWFVVFLREPYVPTAFVLFVIIIWKKNISFNQKVSIGIFILLSVLTLLTVPVFDYLFTIITVNSQTVLKGEIEGTQLLGSGIVKSLLYPVFIFTEGKWTLIRKILVLLDISFFLSLLHVFFIQKKRYNVLFVILILAAAALRVVPPGSMYYESFHLLPWYALFIMSIFLLMESIVGKRFGKIILSLSTLAVVISFVINILDSDSVLRTNIDTYQEFNVGYARYQTYGDALKILSDSNDTLFSELADEILYWQTGLESSYQYAFYTPVTSEIEKYREARINMFKKTPPDFYYYSEELLDRSSIASTIREDYKALSKDNRPPSIFIHMKKVSEITEDQWNQIKHVGFYLTSGE